MADTDVASDVSSCADLLREMIAIDSVNAAIGGRSAAESQLAGYLETQARSYGLDVERWPVRGHADDLMITAVSSSAAPWLLFECHMDTVGVEGMLSDPFDGRIYSDRIGGRGACDAKGAGSAMLWALRGYLAALHRPNNIALLFTVDEEIGRAGIDAFVEAIPSLAWRPWGSIVGEPTSLQLVVAHKGVMRWTIRTLGHAAHSSDPAQGRSAIRAMVPVLEALEGRYIPGLSGTHRLAGAAAASVNVIRGGTSINAIAASCEIGLDRRTLPGEDTKLISGDIETLLADLRVAHPDMEVEADPPLVLPALDSVDGGSFAGHVGRVLEGLGLSPTPRGAGYGSDAGTLAAVGIPAVVLGPGNIAHAHGADEWVSVAELDRAVEVYSAIMAARQDEPGAPR